MDRKKELQLELLKEIDTICRENDIFYILCDNLAVAAYECNSLEGLHGFPKVAMTMEGAEKFEKIVNESMVKDRYFESRRTSPNYKIFSASYGNSNTTDYSFFNSSNYLNSGIEIRILYIVQNTHKSKKRKKFDKTLERAWKVSVQQGVTFKEFTYRACQLIPDFFKLIVGKRRFGRMYYNYVKKHRNIKDIWGLSSDTVVGIKGHSVKLDILRDRVDIDVDGYPMMICRDTQTFLEQTLGRKWEDVHFSEHPKKYDSQVTYTDIPFSEIVPLIEKECNAKKLREDYFLLRYKHLPVLKDRRAITRNWKRFLKAIESYYRGQEIDTNIEYTDEHDEDEA